MKQKLSIILVAITATLLTGCSTGRYVNNSLNMNMNQTQVLLSTNNFRVVKTVSAYVEYKETLHFDYKQLQQNAYAELIRKAKLHGSQMLVNVTLENVQRISGHWYQNGIMAQGVVIEFYDPNKLDEPINSIEENSIEETITVEDIVEENSNRKVITYTSSAFVTADGNVQIPDEYFRFYLLKKFDDNSDGSLSKQELADIRKLDISSRSISNLSGIEYMTSLKVLYADNNNFSIIDLSSNPNLKYAAIKNPKLTTIIIEKVQEIEFDDLTKKDLERIIKYK